MMKKEPSNYRMTPENFSLAKNEKRASPNRMDYAMRFFAMVVSLTLVCLFK